MKHFIWLTLIPAVMCALALAQTPSKEYIRLGGRVIAIENSPISPTGAHFDSTGGAATINVSLTGSWTATASDSFITLATASGSGSGPVNYSVSQNCSTEASRNGTITIAGSAGSYPFTITQDMASTSCTGDPGTAPRVDPVLPTYLPFNSSGLPSQTVAIDTGDTVTPWSVTNVPNWIQVSPMSGTGRGTVQVSASSNGPIQRTGSFIVLGVTVLVSQGGAAALTINPQSAAVQDTATSGSVSVMSTVSWTASSDQTWLHITQGSSGSGNGSVYYSVDQNFASTPRTGNITVTGANGTSQKCTITQASAAPPVTVTPSSLLLATGQSRQFTATCPTACGSTYTIVWSLSPQNASSGSIAADGTYTAPNSVPPGPVTVIANKQGNVNLAGSATVTVGSLSNGATFSISPANSASQPGQSTPFTVSYRFPNGVPTTEFEFTDFSITANPSSGGVEPSTDNSCALEWISESYGTLRLFADTSQGGNGSYYFWTSPQPAPAGTSISNSQCSILVDQVSKTYGGSFPNAVTSFVLVFPIVFRPGFAGTKNQWADAQRSGGGFSIAPSNFGSWTVPGYQPPDLSIDALPQPVSGTAVPITGWALDNKAQVENGISLVEVYLDGNKLGNATLGQSSSSASSACSTYPGRTGCPNVGFSYTWDSSRVPNGTHTIRVVATDTDTTPGPQQNSAQAVVTVTNTVAVSLTQTVPTLGPGQQDVLTATVTGTSTTGVGWSINPNIGILTTGTNPNTATYTAPNTINAMATVTVTATSLADSTKSANAAITLVPVDLNLTNVTINSGAPAYQASHSITATGVTISGPASVTFTAGTVIKLEPNFRATAGTTGVAFHAVIPH
jgi:hypothetical protein